jgi:hypothetical protein
LLNAPLSAKSNSNALPLGLGLGLGLPFGLALLALLFFLLRELRRYNNTHVIGERVNGEEGTVNAEIVPEDRIQVQFLVIYHSVESLAAMHGFACDSSQIFHMPGEEVEEEDEAVQYCTRKASNRTLIVYLADRV